MSINSSNFSPILFILLIVLLVIGCDKKQKFNSYKWKEKKVDWWMTDVRENMIENLIQSDTLIGVNKNEVIEILGEPQKSINRELEYLIREKYGTDIDPEYISNLRIEFDTLGYTIICKVVK